MENLGIKALVEKLNTLNPTAAFTANEDFGFITGTIPAGKLVLPEGYYYNSKNGITNKHRTQSGLYECYDYKYEAPARRRKIFSFGRRK